MVGEILEGELHVSPRPRMLHGTATGGLYGELRGPFDRGRGGPGGWTILIEPELHLGRKPDKVVPDIAGWRRERLPDRVFEPDAPVGVTVPPDWVCEVLSSSTERIDRGKKMRIYRRERVRHVWLVSPALKTVEVYRLDGERFSLLDTHEGDERVRAEPFEAIELALAELWAR